MVLNIHDIDILKCKIRCIKINDGKISDIILILKFNYSFSSAACCLYGELICLNGILGCLYAN